jgi:hypothetical protein
MFIRAFVPVPIIDVLIKVPLSKSISLVWVHDEPSTKGLFQMLKGRLTSNPELIRITINNIDPNFLFTNSIVVLPHV